METNLGLKIWPMFRGLLQEVALLTLRLQIFHLILQTGLSSDNVLQNVT